MLCCFPVFILIETTDEMFLGGLYCVHNIIIIQLFPSGFGDSAFSYLSG